MSLQLYKYRNDETHIVKRFHFMFLIVALIGMPLSISYYIMKLS